MISPLPSTEYKKFSIKDSYQSFLIGAEELKNVVQEQYKNLTLHPDK